MARRLAPWLVPLLALAPLLVTAFPPVQDLPAHAALIEAVAHPQPGGPWETGGPLVQSWGFYLAGAGLAHLVGAWGAAVALLALAAVALPMATVTLARARSCDTLFAAVAATAMAWNQLLVIGFVPFALSLAVALGGLAVLSRQRTPLASLAVSSAAGLLAYEMHAFGLFALAAGLVAIRPQGRRHVAAAFAGLLPAAVLLLASRGSGPALEVDWTFEPLADRLGRLVLMLGPPSQARLPDALPALAVVAGLLLHLRARREPRATAPGVPSLRPVAWLSLAYLAAACVLPDLVRHPPIVLPVTRHLPFFAALVLASVPVATRRWTALAAGLAAASIAWTSFLFAADGAMLAPQAAAIRAIEPGHTVLGATLHRPAPGSRLASYAGIHLPFLYQAAGLGTTIAPFTHADMPVRLGPGAAEDLARGLPAAARRCDIVVSDDTDEPGFAKAMGFDGLPPCPAALPAPWSCRLREGPAPRP